MKVARLQWKNRVFEFKQPVEFTVLLQEQLYVMENSSLGVSVVSETSLELLQELAEQIAMLWDEYADEKDENLSEEALAVARNLREAVLVQT